METQLEVIDQKIRVNAAAMFLCQFQADIACRTISKQGTYDVPELKKQAIELLAILDNAL